jgi:hypothetical protein
LIETKKSQGANRVETGPPYKLTGKTAHTTVPFDNLRDQGLRINLTRLFTAVHQVLSVASEVSENEYRFTKNQFAGFFEVSIGTIENNTEKNKAEFMKNIYEELTDNRLKEFKLAINHQFDPEMDFGIKTVSI